MTDAAAAAPGYGIPAGAASLDITFGGFPDDWDVRRSLKLSSSADAVAAFVFALRCLHTVMHAGTPPHLAVPRMKSLPPHLDSLGAAVPAQLPAPSADGGLHAAYCIHFNALSYPGSSLAATAAAEDHSLQDLNAYRSCEQVCPAVNGAVTGQGAGEAAAGQRPPPPAVTNATFTTCVPRRKQTVFVMHPDVFFACVFHPQARVNVWT